VKYNIEIATNNVEGILERILGCIRQRGFSLCAVSAIESADQQQMLARLTLKSERSIEYVVKQIRKLYDVTTVSIEEMEGEQHGYRQLQAATSQS
jgi:acetolactate synthase regulatory subunit